MCQRSMDMTAQPGSSALLKHKKGAAHTMFPKWLQSQTAQGSINKKPPGRNYLTSLSLIDHSKTLSTFIPVKNQYEAAQAYSGKQA